MGLLETSLFERFLESTFLSSLLCGLSEKNVKFFQFFFCFLRGPKSLIQDLIQDDNGMYLFFFNCENTKKGAYGLVLGLRGWGGWLIF